MTGLRHIDAAVRNGMPARMDGSVVVLPDARTGLQIADLLVHLDGSDLDEGKLRFAEMVATSFAARVEGHLTNCIPGFPMSGDPASGWFDPGFWTSVAAAGDVAEKRLRGRLEHLDTDHELRRFDGMIHELVVSLARRARAVDLVVLARPYGEGREWPEFVEAVLFEAGATALIVPPLVTSLAEPKTILIGWKDTLQTSRAIASALPFLRRARQVFLATVAEGRPDDERYVEPAADVAAHLSRHGVSVELRHLPKWDDPAEGLLDEAQSVGADLLVAGAYGRSRFREMILGGVTRKLLTQSTLPLLLAH